MSVCSQPEEEEVDPHLDLLADPRKLVADLNFRSHTGNTAAGSAYGTSSLFHREAKEAAPCHPQVIHRGTTAYPVSVKVQSGMEEEIIVIVQLRVMHKSHCV